MLYQVLITLILACCHTSLSSLKKRHEVLQYLQQARYAWFVIGNYSQILCNHTASVVFINIIKYIIWRKAWCTQQLNLYLLF